MQLQVRTRQQTSEPVSSAQPASILSLSTFLQPYLGISGITVAGQDFRLQDSIFVMPGLSSISPPAIFSPSPIATHWTFNITAAVSQLVRFE
jgi:hypothetical protein